MGHNLSGIWHSIQCPYFIFKMSTKKPVMLYLDSDSSDISNPPFEVIGGQDILWNRPNNPKCKPGKPVDLVWEVFTDYLDVHWVSSGSRALCKQCNKMVLYHNKSIQVKRHLSKCPQFQVLMGGTGSFVCPKWYSVKKINWHTLM